MTTDKPLFSVCILDHDSPVVADSLTSVFTALLKSHVHKSEVFVVSSSPEVSLALHDLIEKNPDLKVVVLPFGTKKIDMVNYCIRKTSGEFLTLLNSNVILAEDFFVKLYKYKEKLNWFAVVPAARIMESLTLNGHSEALPCKSRFDKDGLHMEFRYGNSNPAPVLSAPFGISTWKRELLVQMNGFSQSYQVLNYSFHADTEATYRAWSFGYGSLYDPTLSVTVIPIHASRSFFTPWPVFLSQDDFIYKLFWNFSYELFILRNRIPAPFLFGVMASLVRFDIWGVLVRILAHLVFLFKKEKYPGLGKAYSFQKIKAVTDKDAL